MTNFKKQLFAATAVGALLLNSVMPLAAYASEVNIVISGNGSSSENTGSVTTNNTTTVSQTNNAVVHNNVDSSANTGSNKANDNTGGDVTIHTGAAATSTVVDNELNKNVASVACCAASNTTVKITDNGTDTENKAKLTQNNTNNVFQDNNADVHNNVDSYAKTGDNKANDNTGGTVTVHTGSAQTEVAVSTLANTNVARIGGHSDQGGSLLAVISGNGSNSENELKIKTGKTNIIFQNNDAKVDNHVDAFAKTGDNKANDNTGGDTEIHTGNAVTLVSVDNSVNFNSAEIACDSCLTDVTAKIDGNGTKSENELKASLNGTDQIWQGGEEYGNHANLDNHVDGFAKTGYNGAKDNTGPAGLDPVEVWTGTGYSDVSVSNSGNVNVVGNLEMPTFEFDWNLLSVHFGWM